MSRLQPFLNERGAAVVVVSVSLVVLFGMAALAIDIGHLFVKRNELQNSADAAALAGVSQLPDAIQVRAVAKQYAQSNMPVERDGLVLVDSDIFLGDWDGDTRTFTPGSTSPNAVKVTTRRSSTNGNPVNHLFAPILGINPSSISAEAIAINDGGDCFSKGLTVGGEVSMGQDMRLDKYCVYGGERVEVGQDPHLCNGALIGARDEGTITYGQGFSCCEGPIEDCLFEGGMQPEYAQSVENIINDIENGDFPSYYDTAITQVEVSSSLPSQLTEGTAYIINGNVSIGQDYQVQNVIIAARPNPITGEGGNITWGQDGAIRNTGSPSSGPAIGIYATNDITFGQDAQVYGAHLIAGRDLHIGQDIREMDASIQVGRNAYVDQDPHFESTWPGFEKLGGPSGRGYLRLVK